MNREYHRWFSPRLYRDMELLIFGHAGARVLVFPTREGRFYDYENWHLVAALGERIEQGHLQLFCVDSLDSEALYCRHIQPACRMARHKQYEAYILEEVLPLMHSRGTGPLVAHGCSIGAYHAVNLAFRNPHIFDRVLALSGRYDLTRPMGPFVDLFDGYYDADVYFHTPNHYIPNLADPWILDHLRRMDITFVIGEHDPFYPSNLELSQALWSKGVRNRLVVWDQEAHKARYWRDMVRQHL
jgi:esterase/lipase superfamily enzyme